MFPLKQQTLLLLVGISAVGALVRDCPIGWEESDLTCYHFVFYPTRVYAETIAACQVDGASLLSINSASENSFISRWLTNWDHNRRNKWYTSGSGGDPSFVWEGDGSKSQVAFDWWIDSSAANITNQVIVYKYSVPREAFLLSRTHKSASLPYICEISKNEAFRVHQAVRDFTYGQTITDPNAIVRGPKFYNRPLDLVIVEKDPIASLECRASGNPRPSFQWFKNVGTDSPREVTSATDSRYTLTNGKITIQNPITSADSGSYQCVADNSVGKIISDPIKISFGYLHQFSNDPSNSVNALLYQGTFIKCLVPAYNPGLTYQWYKDDAAHFVRPELNHYQFISHNGNLYLSEVQQSDAGYYHCVVTLTVPIGQRMSTKQPPSRTSLGIRLNVLGETALDLIPSIHNDFPTVFPNPSLRGQDLRLECLAYGKLPLHYKWTRLDKGQKIGLPSNSKLEDHNRVLLIKNARMEDGGNYTCHVTRENSGGDHKTFFLAMQAKPYFIFPLKDQYIDVGARLKWRCLSTAVPRAEYSWYKDTVLLSSVSGDVEISGNVLTIVRGDVAKHSGMYQCSAKNRYGTTFSTAELKVLAFAPIFNKEPVTDKMASVGGNVTMICQPESAPEPEIKWSHNGRALGLTPGTEGRLQLLQNGNLLLSQLSSGDGGTYRCSATNKLGTAHSEGTLLVAEPTVLSNQPTDTRVIVNNTAFLFCEASFDNYRYDLVYSWTFNGHPVDIAGNPFFVQGVRGRLRGLYIRNAQFIHAGEYTCQAQTVAAMTTASAHLTVLGPPGEPAGVYADQLGSDLTLYWSDGGTRGSPIISYVIEFNTTFNHRWRILTAHLDASGVQDQNNVDKRLTKLHSLRPGTGYMFRVRAVNVFGVGNPSRQSVIYHLPSAAPVVPPGQVRGGGGKVGTLVITWGLLSLEDESGPGVGYTIYWRRRVGINGKWRKLLVPNRYWPESQGKVVKVVGIDNYYLEYEVKVGAFNQLGPGPNSTIEVIYSAEGMPYATPTNLQLGTYNATAISIAFNPIINTREMVKGKILGYLVLFWIKGDAFNTTKSFHYGAVSQLLVIGLLPNQDYEMKMQVFNSAGLGPLGEMFQGSTAGTGPKAYPEYVEIHSHSATSVFVQWRGISTMPIDEESLRGYKLRYWPAHSDLRDAHDVIVDFKKTSGVIDNLERGIVYKLRVTAFSLGGDGTKAPPVLFTLGGQIQYDRTTTEILATGSRVTLSFLCLLSCAMVWITPVTRW